VEDEDHPEAVTGRLEAVNGTAAEFERGGPVVNRNRDSSRPKQVERALIGERLAELEALAQAGTSAVWVSLGDGRAHGEQAGGGDEGRGADLAGQSERFARQRDRPGRVTHEDLNDRGDAELEGGVGEVASGPRDAGGLFGGTGGVCERAASVGDV